ncbi:MAG: DDE-type integrase/transposase/recombinase [Candidatus Doudnabacteria bacterium]|nr:DDE-type integrase/transposase/recombinase [Candidatus Doudnabacteria bacterium]
MNYQTFTTQQKWSIIEKVESSSDRSRELLKLDIPRSTYYDWLKAGGLSKKKTPHTVWNRIPEHLEAKIRSYRLSGDPLKHSPARIVEQLEQQDNFIISESGVKSVLVRLKLNGFLKPKKKHYHVRPKAEKFLEVVCADDVEFIRQKPHDTFVLNFTDESSYLALESRVYEHRTNSYDIIKGLKNLKQTYGRYPKILRLDNAQAHKARKVFKFLKKHGINPDFITKGCPEENWPVESWHRNLNQDVIYQHGYSTIEEWQKAVDDYRYFHNHLKRLRSDPIKRTPHEIAFAYTTPLTQARLKIRLKRKHYGQTSVQKYLPDTFKHQSLKLPVFKPFSVSEMCVS